MSTTITVSLKDVLDKIKNNKPQRKPQDFLDYRRPLSETLDTRSKSFYQNCCISARGKCARCKAPDCRDRGWRERGEDVP